MSENDFGAFGDEKKMLEYVYDDVDDSDIFATGPLNNSSSTESENKGEADSVTTSNPEIIQENETLKETLENLRKEKEILQLRISELYKTAKAELDRKDRRLKELQTEKDNLVFRRGGNIRYKPFNVDKSVPVLQQVEIDVKNEEFQNLNVRYRIPKKISNADKNQDPSETKKLPIKLEQEYTSKSDNKLPITSIGSNEKDCDKHEEFSGKNFKSHTDRSRSRDRLNSRKPPKKENESPNNDKLLSIEGCKREDVQGRSKSSSRYKNDSPNSKKPRSPSRDRQEVYPTKRNRSKSMNEDVKFENKKLYSSSTSREKEQVPSSRARSRSVYGQRSPSHDYKQNSDQKQNQILNHLSRNQGGKPRTPSREKQEELPGIRYWSKSTNEDSKLVDSRASSSNTTSRDKKPSSKSRERSTTPDNKHRSSSNEHYKKNSYRERSKSSSRYNNVFPDNRVGPRTPSVEKEGWPNKRSRLINEKTSKQQYNKGHSRSRSAERECDMQSSRQSNRQEYGQKKEDICSSSRRNRLDLEGTESAEDGKSDLKKKYKDFEGNSRKRSCSPLSLRNKSSGNSKERSSKDPREKEKDPRHKIIDLREKVTRRSRSASSDRYRKRVFRSRSRETYRRRPDSKSERRCHEDRSNSSSTERDKRHFNNKAKSPIRRDRYGNVVTSKSTENRSRLLSRERHSRARDFGQLRERLMRYSIDREFRDRQGEHRHADKDRHTFDKMKDTMNNQSDHSDLDEIKLYLSGDSDQGSENNDHKRKSDEISNGDNDFEIIKDIGFDIQNLSDEDLQRLLETRKKVFNKISNLNEDVRNLDTFPAVQFCYTNEKINSNGKYDTEHIQKHNVFSHCDNNIEELDYEHSLNEFPINLKRDKTEKLDRMERKDNASNELNNTTEIQPFKEGNLKNPQEEKSRCEKDKRWHTSNTAVVQESWQEEKSIEDNKEPIRNLFELRQHKKLLKHHQKGEKSLNIIRKQTQANTPDVDSLKLDPRIDIYEESITRKQLESLEKDKFERIVPKNCDAPKSNKKIHNKQMLTKEIIPETCDVFQYINNVKQVFMKVGEECNMTRKKITNSLGNVTKGMDLREILPADSSCKLDDESGNSDNQNELKILRNEEKEVKNIMTKKMEKISLRAYKSRKKSIDVRIDDIDSKEPVRTVTNVSDDGENETNVSIKNDEVKRNTMLESNEKLSVENTDLPEGGDHIQKNYINQGIDNVVENVKNYDSNELNSQDKVSAQYNEQSTQKVQEDTVKCQSKPENDAFSFIHDLDTSDDEAIVQDNFNLSKKENNTVDCYKKINILSNITIQSPSYTPPHPKKPENILEGNVDLKERASTKSRKSLFKMSVCPEETLRPVTNLLETKDCDSDPLPIHSKTPENKLEVLDSGPQTVEIDSGQINSLRPPCVRSEYLDQIQEQVKTITGYMSPLNSSTSKSNAKSDHFDTEGLQKCLEEDITNPNAQTLDHDDAITKKDKLSLETHTVAEKIELELNNIKSEKERGKRKDKTKKRKKEHKHKKDKRSKTPTSLPVIFDVKKMDELFGPMTPSPCKAEEILEENITRDKAKRNIMKCEGKNCDNNICFRIRDQNEETPNHNVNKENKNVESKTESKQTMDAVIAQEECKQLFKKVDNKEIEGLKNFCTNPTYIPNIRDTPKAVFESPNHYICKRNDEMKEKIKRNLIEDPSSKKNKNGNVMLENIGAVEEQTQEEDEEENVDVVKKKQEKSSEKSTEHKSIEDKCIKEPKQKKKRKSKNFKDDIEKKDSKIVPKAKAKRGRKTLQDKHGEVNEETKTTLKQSASMEEKKPRNPSFKIKINSAKRRQKGNAKENAVKRRRIFVSDEDSDSFEESDKINQTCTNDVISSNNKFKNQEANIVELSEKSTEPSSMEDFLVEDSMKETNPQKLKKKRKSRNSMDDVEREDSKIIPKVKDKRGRKTLQEKHEEKCIETKIRGRPRKNNQTEMKEEQKRKSLDEQKFSCEENTALQKSSHQVRLTVDSDVKESSAINDTKGTRNCVSIEETSINNITRPSNESIGELVKTIKRITPTRIGDCTLSKEKEQSFKDLKAKRELFIEHPESLLNSNKRRRLSNDSDDYTTKKYHKVTYTESRTTVDEDVIDNGAQTHIKVQETQLNIEVAPNCSPLPRIEQTYDALSKNTALNNSSPLFEASNPQLQPSHEGVFPDIVLTGTENTFPLLNLDTKDLTMLGPLEKDIYKNLSDFSLSGNSMLFANVVGDSKKSGKDSNDDNVRMERDKTIKESEQLCFTNFLNNKNPNTSTPIKTNQPKCVKTNFKPKHSSLQSSASVVSSSTSSIAGTNITTMHSSSHNSNVSDNKTSSGMSSNVSGGSIVFKTHVKFSRTLKRDRRRPICMMVLD